MCKHKLNDLIVGIAVLLAVANPLAGFAYDSGPILEIPNPRLPDVAMVHSVEGLGTVIFYNPILCTEAGEALCEFFRMHEYGHIAMGHLEVANPDQETRKREEAEADRWAARNAATHAVQAAHRHFQSGGGETPIHGTGKERAARIAWYAGAHPSDTAQAHRAESGLRGIAAEVSSSRAAGLRPVP